MLKSCILCFTILALLGGCVVRVPNRDAPATPPASQAELIREVQEGLNAAGYDAGPADGVSGPRTTEAVRGYQRDNGLTVDGVIDAELYAALYGSGTSSDTSPPSRTGSGTDSSGIRITNACAAMAVHRVYRGIYGGVLPTWFAEIENLTDDRYYITADVEYRERYGLRRAYSSTQYSDFTIMVRPRQRGDVNIVGNRGDVEVLSFDLYACERA